MKTCRKCQEEKPFDDYYITEESLRYHDVCKPCQRAKSLAYYRSKRDRIAEKARTPEYRLMRKVRDNLR